MKAKSTYLSFGGGSAGLCSGIEALGRPGSLRSFWSKQAANLDQESMRKVDIPLRDNPGKAFLNPEYVWPSLECY